MNTHPTPAPMTDPPHDARGFQPAPPHHILNPLRPLRPLLGPARIGAWVLMGFSVLSTAVTLAGYRASLGTDLGRQSDLEVLDARVTLLSLLGYLFAFIVGCRWLGRARRNTALLPPFRHPTLGPAWAWWSWVVPIVSWWFPRTVVLEVWADPLPGSPARRLVNRWWGWWVAATVMDFLASRFGGESTAAVLVLSLVHTICLGLALHAWLEILARITADQDEVIGVPRPQQTAWPPAG